MNVYKDALRCYKRLLKSICQTSSGLIYHIRRLGIFLDNNAPVHQKHLLYKWYQVTRFTGSLLQLEQLQEKD